MPEEPESEADVAELVAAIEAGKDEIAVPQELLDEANDPAAAPAPAPAQSLYAQILTMTIGQKIKLAIRGNHDARTVLIRDTNKMIRRFVMLNPRISDNEVIGVARNKSVDEELLRIIVQKREWMRNYQVRLALAVNPKTALPVALRQLATLDDREVRQIAKSKNVPQAVAAHARRLLFTVRAPK